MDLNIENRCIICNAALLDDLCTHKCLVNVGEIERYELLLNKLRIAAESENFMDMLMILCQKIDSQIKFMFPLNLIPVDEFNPLHHNIDEVAKEYLGKCNGVNN